jgi:ABC-type multidrug transport system ATPase subunit
MIAFEHVSKRFGRVIALHEVSLQIARGERVAFVGANGSGKTTLLRALLGLVRVSGRALVAGVDVAEDPKAALAHLAYIPQISPPLDAPVCEVVTAYAALRGVLHARIAEQADPLGLDLEAVAHTRFRDLSGGMKQKLLAALALSTRAEVLVCDEPTANLDASARTAFFAELARRDADQIVILCSHREEEVHSFVERVIELRDGQLVRDERSQPVTRARLRAVP